jgi:hypothetical protein
MAASRPTWTSVVRQSLPLPPALARRAAIPRRDTKAQAKALIARFGGIGPLLLANAGAPRREGLSDGVIGAMGLI